MKGRTTYVAPAQRLKSEQGRFSRSSGDEGHQMLVIGVGASAGGIEAFRSFFDHLPPKPGFAVVLALHLPAERKSMLREILQSWTAMHVRDVEQGMPVETDTVYVVPPHTTLSISDNALWLAPIASQQDKLIRPIDSLFDAIGSAYNDNAVAVVLSGTGSDGALGVKAIKERGGLAIAQGGDGDGPQHGGMPAAAIATGAVDMVLRIEDIAAALVKYASSLEQVGAAAEELDDDSQRLRICKVMQQQIGHDFSGYREKTFNRRVRRRMQVLGISSLNDYVALIEQHSDEVDILFRDLLIRVTSFFRDPATFAVLTSAVMPRLFAGANAQSEIRVWVPGCATGEEAYSLGIVMFEYLDRLKSRPKIQIFATDIDDAAISLARLGRYPGTLVDGLSEQRLQRFFHASDGSYVVSKDIRELCTFSTHSLVRDPPFSRMNLVSCRNLLIYFDNDLQEKVIPLFHYSLARAGILLLGSSESTARHPDLFEPIDKEARIFQRLDHKQVRIDVPVDARPQSESQRRAIQSVRRTVDSFRVPAEFSRPEASEQQQQQGDVAIEPEKKNAPSRIKDAFRALVGQSTALEGELERTRMQLRTLGDQHQTALEELRSAIEELHSVNEEMQSTNEELETSKEELQSVNEELRTVNMRLSEKVEELDNANSDLRNLFESTEIATVFLDEFLLIRSFTPAIGTLFNLIPSDQGRPLTDIKSHLDYHDLKLDVNAVLQTLEPFERRVTRDDDSAHYMMRILPYRNPDSSVGGTLVTFVDITSIVQAESAMRAADERKDVFLATLSHELRNPLAPIRTAAGILASSRISDAELARVQAIISRQAVHMTSLLDDLLDISRVTRGALVLKRDYVDLNGLLDDVIEVSQTALAAKALQLEFTPVMPRLIAEVDPVRITQAVTNLISNAVKYTPHGGNISIACNLSGNDVSISVADSGIGISPDSVSRVFDMFSQVDPRVEAADGLGIGLALVKGLAEMHGGWAEAESPGLGHGSTFTIHLPGVAIAEAPDTKPISDATPRQGVSRRVLIADDNQDGAVALEIFLRINGHVVEVAHSGEEALAKAKEFRPDVAVLDIGMPSLNGYQVAERIRQEAWGKDMMLIALTGWGQVDDKRRALAAGFDRHVTKPVDPAELIRLFE